MSEKISITVKTERMILLPTLPNFLRTELDECFPIENFTQEQLREIGEKWTEALMRRARDRSYEAIRRQNKTIGQLCGSSE